MSGNVGCVSLRGDIEVDAALQSQRGILSMHTH